MTAGETASAPADRPWAYSAFPVEVRARVMLSPRFVRVTLAGESLRHFAAWGRDQRIKLVLPLPGGRFADFGLLDEPTPHPSDWYARWRALPEDERNVLRTYTPAAIRPDEGEIDVDFFLHEPAGPASAWAAAAVPGDRVVINGPDSRMGWTGYGLHWQPGDARRFLLVADETAFPAVRGILDSLPVDADADVVLECADPADDVVSAGVPAPVRVRLLHHGSPSVDAAVRKWGLEHGAATREDDGFYAWIAGEAGATTAVRRYLVSEVGIAKERVSFLGYWKRGGPLIR
ncbi:siderophore-interacting protein [Microbacterium sp. cx-59]|uniref:siderophore-interacting protein n=1 Tax=Microbacterium sp. cx-59 TaxID=2891207 RepID=UPI001E4974E0|nr:siderophore-interacting protein [Microbacterium sp. cx-59]MCC4907671.1 siderophore-interacting protein [Microbacterium sp. cx-59]